MNSLHIKNGTGTEALSVRAAAHVPGYLENRVLRQAVQENLVSFPSQVPVFERQSRPDLQPKVVVLYFVRGWTMDDIAQRYGLGRQRMGQILTAWRIRAVKEGYILPIDPEHPLLKRVRLEEADPYTEMPAQKRCGAPQAGVRPIRLMPEAMVTTAGEHEPPSGMASVTDRGRSKLAEQLHAMVDVLDNQLRLRSSHIIANIDSCEPLLASARTLCERLESSLVATHASNEWGTTAAISAARQLFQRLEEHVPERSAPHSKLTLRQNLPPRFIAANFQTMQPTAPRRAHHNPNAV